MSTSTLTALLSGHLPVRIDLRTSGGLERVASGRLVDRDRTGNRIRLLDEVTGRFTTVALTSAHTVAYTPGRAV